LFEYIACYPESSLEYVLLLPSASADGLGNHPPLFIGTLVPGREKGLKPLRIPILKFKISPPEYQSGTNFVNLKLKLFRRGRYYNDH
jgi:hypothetical protein